MNACFWCCKEALLSLTWHNFSGARGKSPDYAEADVSKLCGSVLPHPLGCPVKRGKDISCDRNCNFLCPNGHMQE